MNQRHLFRLFFAFFLHSLDGKKRIYIYVCVYVPCAQLLTVRNILRAYSRTRVYMHSRHHRTNIIVEVVHTLRVDLHRTNKKKKKRRCVEHVSYTCENRSILIEHCIIRSFDQKHLVFL